MPVRTIYATTLPTWYDTKSIAKGKLLQQLSTPSAVGAGSYAPPSTTNTTFSDTEVKTLQKILIKLQ